MQGIDVFLDGALPVTDSDERVIVIPIACLEQLTNYDLHQARTRGVEGGATSGRNNSISALSSRAGWN